MLLGEKMELAPGMRLIIREEEWMVKKIELNSLNNNVIHCEGISSIVKGKKSIFLSDLEKITKVDPREVNFVKDDSPHFLKSRLYIESQWREQIPTDTKIHIGHRAAMDQMNFQLVPAQVALEHLRQRILIADTVGLGKTLEAGILISELIARGKGKRILVVTVKSMMMQFQKELWNRFTIPLIRLDSKKIQKIKSELPANYNPFFYYDKTIISIDTLKQTQASKRTANTSNVMDYRQHLENARWDIIVIDEAHNVAERGENIAQRASLAKLLSKHSDTLIMLSATPHDGRPKSFASLMRMLDLTAIPDMEDYDKDQVGDLCIRRHKKDIKDDIVGKFKDRKVSIIECKATKNEEAAFDFFVEMNLKTDIKRASSTDSNFLFKTGLEKALFSSPAACIKSIEERVKKLNKSSSQDANHDIIKLNTLKSLLQKVDRKTFSKYQALIKLLESKEYNWSRLNDDRIVIFTERIETMNFLADSLLIDTGFNKDSIVKLYGGLSDFDQQKIVEDFGRNQSEIRILVASDVASEGINLHYLSHRMIHFDIPWSLMIFQQRNGRIDRYGQEQQPDIRYFKIESDNPKIKGDVRILEILIKKEAMAEKNLGDVPLLAGLNNIQEEEKRTAKAIEDRTSAEKFSEELEEKEKKFNVMEILMSKGNIKPKSNNIKEDRTLYKDIDYIETAIKFFNKDVKDAVSRMSGEEGIVVKMANDLKRRLTAVIPEEIIAKESTINLSPDKNYCIKEMKFSLQNSLSEEVWPSTQYLWPLHPIFEWVNEKSSLLYKRGEAPLLGLTGTLKPTETIFIVAGMIPNRKATPVVSDWLVLRYVDGKYANRLTMQELIEKTGLGKKELPNRNILSDNNCITARQMVNDVIDQAESIFKDDHEKYKARTETLINKEMTKLSELETRQVNAINKQYQKYFESTVKNQNIIDFDQKKDNTKMSKKEESKRREWKETIEEVNKDFEEFANFVTESLEIEDKPYLHIIAALTGV